jgi:Metallo-beta-lactamase superfamily
VSEATSLYSCPVAQQVVLHGDVSHTQPRRGADSPMQRQGLGEATSFTTHQGRYVLVDAGYEGSALHKKLRRPVDVLLMTHNDQDHVGGAPELLHSPLISQVWLPYDWYLLYSAGANLVDAVRYGNPDLAPVAREARDQVTRAVEMLHDSLVSQKPIDEPIHAPALPRRILGWLDNAFDSLDSEIGAEVVGRAENALGAQWIGTARATAGGVTSGRTPGQRARATVRAVDAVLWWDGPTRWFSIDHASAPTKATALPWERSGLTGEFTVVNALPVRVHPLPRPTTAALAYALLAALYRLTIQNRRALVALGHTQFGCGHVLFASDSAFEFDQLADPVVPWAKIGAAVGLHHGSAGHSHDHLYEKFDGAALARSGSCSVRWTHSQFTGMPSKRRGCTWCHADGSQKGGFDRHRDVELEASQDGGWRVIAGACIDCPRFA